MNAARSTAKEMHLLSDAALRSWLSETVAREGAPVITERAQFKKRDDWRGRRMFERLILVGPHSQTKELCLKYVAPANESAVVADAAVREASVYSILNDHTALGAPQLFGARFGSENGQGVLLLEFVRGKRLKEYVDLHTWEVVAEWLGGFHAYFAQRTAQFATSARLPRSGRDFLDRLGYQATDAVERHCPDARPKLLHVLKDLPRLADTLENAPQTLVHGEFYCTNIMIRAGGEGARVCAFDWETAFVGCGVLDLVCLGRQKLGFDRNALRRAYQRGWNRAGWSAPTAEQLEKLWVGGRIQEGLKRLGALAEQEAIPARRIRKKIGKLGDQFDELIANSGQ